jgi:hypothetical protein
MTDCLPVTNHYCSLKSSYLSISVILPQKLRLVVISEELNVTIFDSF